MPLGNGGIPPWLATALVFATVISCLVAVTLVVLLLIEQL